MIFIWRLPFSLVNLAVSLSVVEFSQNILASIGCRGRSYRQVSSRSLCFAKVVGVCSLILSVSVSQQRKNTPRKSKIMILSIFVFLFRIFISCIFCFGKCG